LTTKGENMKLTKTQLKTALEHGYFGLVATPENETEFNNVKENLDYARNVGDSHGIMISLQMIQNYNAVKKALDN